MQWETVPPLPAWSTERWITKFAWFPIKCINNITVWLEHYDQQQSYYHEAGWMNKYNDNSPKAIDPVTRLERATKCDCGPF